MFLGAANIIPKQDGNFWGRQQLVASWDLEVPVVFNDRGTPTHYRKERIPDNLRTVTLKYGGQQMLFWVDRGNGRLVPFESNPKDQSEAQAAFLRAISRMRMPTPDPYRDAEKHSVFQARDWASNPNYPILHGTAAVHATEQARWP